MTRGRLTRRTLLAAAATLQLGCDRQRRPSTKETSTVTQKLPTVYVPHGGGPWPFVDIPGLSGDVMGGLRGYLEGIPATLPATPRALLVVSAHWEERVPTVQSSAKPPMLYDYSGFPKASYELQWPAPGAPSVCDEVRTVLEKAGIESARDDARGYDHGAFVVTKLMYPEPKIPTFQLSLTADLDPRRMLAVGRALAPLRDRGVFILGSGFSYHNLRAFRSPGARDDSKAFDDWLAETVSLEPSARAQRLAEWDRAPKARACHPREEHLLPLMVCAGAAEEKGTMPFRNVVMGVHTLAAQFG